MCWQLTIEVGDGVGDGDGGRDGISIYRARDISPSHRRSRQAAVAHLVMFFFFLYWPNYLGPLEEVASLIVFLHFLRRLLGFAPWFLPRVL